MSKLVECINPNKIIRAITFIWLIVMLFIAAFFIFVLEERNIVLGTIFALAAVLGPVRALRDFPVFYIDNTGRVYTRRFFRSKLINRERISDRGELTLPVYPVYAPEGFFISLEKENNGDNEDTFYILKDDNSELAKTLYRSI